MSVSTSTTISTMTTLMRIAIEDGILRGRKPPARLCQYLRISTDQWDDVRQRIYHATRPALGCKQMVLVTLLGFLAVPLVSFVVLFALIQTGYLNIMEDDYDDYDEYGNLITMTTTATTEDAFELILVAATCGCLALGVLCLLLGSWFRRSSVQATIDAQFAPVLEDLRLLLKDEGLVVTIVASTPSGSTVSTLLRRIFLAWCDVDFALVVSTDPREHDEPEVGAYERL